MTILRGHTRCESQRAHSHCEEICCHRRYASGETSSSFSHLNPRQRNMTRNRTKWLFWQLAVGLSMIAVAAGHAATAPVDLDFEEEFEYSKESRDQIFGDSSHPENDRSLQFGGFPQEPNGPPISFPPNSGSSQTPRPSPPASTPSTPRPTFTPVFTLTRRPSANPPTFPTQPNQEPTDQSLGGTPRPTEAPTKFLGFPFFPTPVPTPRATPVPTPRPTRTRNPTPVPVPIFLFAPTNAPRPELTPRPSPRPTDRLTRGPTNRPTPRPTFRNTNRPTRRPTPAPSRSPTNRPTRRPTNIPTRPPTPSPSLRPTTRPTRRPTPNPTNRPTTRPTSSPTISPSAAPSSTPSRSPSLRPSASPSSSPSDSPSEAPSSSPSLAPSVSFQPSISSEPSLAPTPDFEFTLITLEAFRVIMEFSIQGDGRRLQEDSPSSNLTEEECTALWVDYISQSMKSEVEQVIPRYETLNVRTYNVSRDTFQDLEVLAFFYDVKIDIRSAIIVHNLRRYIGGPFDSSSEQNALVETMRASNCSEYADLLNVRVILPDESNISGGTKSGDGDVESTLNSGVIGGSVVAIAGAAMLFAVLIFVRIKRKRDVFEEVFDGTQSPDEFEVHDNEMASEIGLQTDVDVSTLGDPIPQGTFQNTGDMSTAGSYSLDYDYKVYCNEGPLFAEETSAGGGEYSLANTLLPEDDDTFDNQFDNQYGVDEQFEVLAPAGVLGLILETNEDGVPTINNIKPASILADQVEIGDRLMSVDGVDVSIMLASDVSRLIAFKKEAQVRKFVFTRPRKGASGFDGDHQSIDG